MSGNVTGGKLIALLAADMTDTGSERKLGRWTASACAIIVLGSLLGAVTVVFICTLVYAYQLVTPEETESVDTMRRLAAGWVPGLFFALGAVGSAFLVGLRASLPSVPAGTLFGVLLGIVAAATEQAIAANFEGVLPRELVIFVLLGVIGGAVGGCWGSLEVGWTEASEKALFREMVNIARAEGPNQVAEAIANLAGREKVAGVGVWLTSPFCGRAAEEPIGVWEHSSYGSFPAAILLDLAKQRSRNINHVQHLLVDTLDQDARRVWTNSGLRSALAGPMVYMGGESLGFLFVGFRRTILFTGARRKRVLSAAAAAGLALEKLSGLEKQRHQDRKLGMMEERERVSREIHDSLVQYLGSITAELDATEIATEAGAEEMVPRHLERAYDAARLASGEARRLVRAMRPEILDGTSLQEALAALVQRFSEESGIRTTFKTTGEVHPLSPETEHALTRIAQEALSNARKHSGAACVVVSLNFEGECIMLEVTDDGAGMGDGALGHGVARVNGGFGVQSMRERAEWIGGHFRIENSGNIGTKVVVEAPVRSGNVRR